MGIEIWALLSLIAILAGYILPFLVGRREVMGYTRVDDRYSEDLRILQTHTVPGGDGSKSRTEYMGIFLRRPKVQSMNRPAVRNVQVVRTERDLARARRARAEAARRRRQAATRRAHLAVALLGVTGGVAVLVAVTALPWQIILLPLAALMGATVLGSRVAARGREEDRAVRRRISALERQLRSLETRSLLPNTEVESGRTSAEADAEKASTAKSVPAIVSDVANLQVAGASDQSIGAESQAPEPVAQESATSQTDSVTDNTAAPVVEPTLSTPPQGWSPVVVPAPTYTLAAQAPRRKIPELNLPVGETAKVPMRPTDARPWGDPVAAEQEYHPIDLEAVLERRRAAGA